MQYDIDPTIDDAPTLDPGDRARRDLRNVELLCGQLRRAVFRRYVRNQLSEMSSPVKHLLERFDLALPTALRRLTPTAAWPRLAGDVPHRDPSVASLRRGGTCVRWPRAAIPRASLADGRTSPMASLILENGASREYADVSLVGRCLEMLVTGPTFELHTAAGRGCFVHRSRLPTTMLSSVVNRPLDEIVRHPLIGGRGYVVDQVGDCRKGTFFEFEVGTEPVTMPC